MENVLRAKTRMFGPTMVEVKGNLRNHKGDRVRVVICMETGETVSSNVPIGGDIWRKLARIARAHAR